MALLTKQRSEAEEEFSRAFEQAQDDFGVDAEAAHRAAFERFLHVGLPNRRLESWHYSDLRARLRRAPPLAAAPGPEDVAFARVECGSRAAPNTLKLVLVDGRPSAELSDTAIAGLQLRTLATMPVDDPAWKNIAAIEALTDDPLFDLNGAFARDGWIIEIAPGAQIDQPIELISLCGATGAQARFARNFVHVGAGAKVSLLETRAEGVGGFGDSALLLDLEDGAELDYACRCTSSAPVEVQSVVARVGAKARLRAAALLADAPFLRRQMSVLCQGEYSEVLLAGAALLNQQNHADTTLAVKHEAAHCLSRETFKYVLDDEAEGVFQGKISVDAQAQKTDGKMLCRGLVLSDNASMSAKPELEIFADDVVCGHGASCAKLDAAQVFYMESRGLPQDEAEAMLIEAFAAETFDVLQNEFLRDVLLADLSQLLQKGRSL